jgi:hypothetical protein
MVTARYKKYSRGEIQTFKIIRTQEASLHRLKQLDHRMPQAPMVQGVVVVELLK